MAQTVFSLSTCLLVGAYSRYINNIDKWTLDNCVQVKTAVRLKPQPQPEFMSKENNLQNKIETIL